MTKTVNSKAEFTATEDRLIEILTRGLNEVLENSWRDLIPVTFKEQAREVNPQFASFVDGADTVIICSFVVQLPNIDPATFQIIYPLQTLKPIASQLRSRISQRSLMMMLHGAIGWNVPFWIFRFLWMFYWLSQRLL